MNHRVLPTILLATLALGVRAAAPDTERERIVAEREEAARQFTEQQRTCRAGFVVAPCLEAARKEHAATLSRLRREEVQLDEAKRRASAEARSQAIRDKTAAQDARASAADDGHGGFAREANAPKSRAAPRSGDGGSLLGSPREKASAMAPAVEEQNKAKFETRARAAQAHREEVERRNVQRAAQGKGVAPLPLPASAAAP